MNIQKLRDMNLHEVADELEQLRAFKAELENQEPITRQDIINVLLSTNGMSEGITADAILEMLLGKGTEPSDKPVVAVPDGWNIVTSENWNIPKVGQRVILFSNGVIQEESYTLDQADGELCAGHYFWSRDDLDECPEVKVGDMWMAWPDEAAPSHSQQSAGEDPLSIIGKALESTIGGLRLQSDGTSEVEIYDPMAGDGTRLICFDNHSQLIEWAERTVALFNHSPAHDSEQGE